MSAELVNYLDNSLTNRLKRETEKQESARVETAAQKSGKKSGQLQTAASIVEPNVIDIDAALAQMEICKGGQGVRKKRVPAGKKKAENLEKSKKAIKSGTKENGTEEYGAEEYRAEETGEGQERRA